MCQPFQVPGGNFFDLGQDLPNDTSRCELFFPIGWVVPLPSNSDHQDYYIFSRESL